MGSLITNMWFRPSPLPPCHVTRRMRIANFAFKMARWHCFHPLLSNGSSLRVRLSSSHVSRHIGQQLDREDDPSQCVQPLPIWCWLSSGLPGMFCVMSSLDVLFFACHHLESMTLQSSKVAGLVDAESSLCYGICQFSWASYQQDFVCYMVPMCDVQDLVQASLMENIQLLYNLYCNFPRFTGVYSNRHQNCFI